MIKKIANLILLSLITITFILFNVRQNNFELSKLILTNLVLLVLFIITIIELINKNDILNNNKYNNLLLLSNIITIIIILRDLFDKNIILRSSEVVAFGITDSTLSYGPSFIDYNLIFIIIIYGGLLIYNLINKNLRNS